jgi:hypothetical protein
MLVALGSGAAGVVQQHLRRRRPSLGFCDSPKRICMSHERGPADLARVFLLGFHAEIPALLSCLLFRERTRELDDGERKPAQVRL